MFSVFVHIVHVFVCLVLMLVVLLQQGKGGGFGAAFGGASAQVFGGRGAGNILTRATAICAGVFMITSVSLASMSSWDDRGLRARAAAEESKKKDHGTPRDVPAAPSGAPAPGSAAPASPASPASPAAPASSEVPPTP